MKGIIHMFLVKAHCTGFVNLRPQLLHQENNHPRLLLRHCPHVNFHEFVDQVCDLNDFLTASEL